MPAIPLAYKFVATAAMLAEVNYCASRLHLPVKLPVEEKDLVHATVFRPKLGLPFGRLDTTNFSFSFGQPGRLIFITRLDSGYQAYSTSRTQGKLPTTKFLPQLAGIPSIIDTNGAYRIATNWLTSIEVDVSRLEKEHPPVLTQQSIMGYGPIPVFYVDWGQFTGLNGPARNIHGPAVRAMIAGDTKDLLYLRQEDDAYSRRPALLRNLDELLAISDEEFLKYSDLQRSNLLARFAAIRH